VSGTVAAPRQAAAGAQPLRRLLFVALPFLESVLGVVAFVLLWAFISSSLKNPQLLPSPSVVYAALKSLLGGEIYPDIWASLVHLGIGYVIGIALGLALAVLAARFIELGAFIEPVIEVLRPISAIAWIPIAILMFGVSAGVPIFLIAYAAVFPIFVSTLDGIRRLDVSLLNAARSLGASSNFVTTHVVLPGAMPYVLTGARLSLGVAWMAMVAGELVGADAGLGWRIMWFQEFFAMDRVMAIILVIGVLGFFADAALRSLQRSLLHWQPTEAS
jgi:ABC-type nitrate/sulfonate/bicarbonate transport system permease component